MTSKLCFQLFLLAKQSFFYTFLLLQICFEFFQSLFKLSASAFIVLPFSSGLIKLCLHYVLCGNCFLLYFKSFSQLILNIFHFLKIYLSFLLFLLDLSNAELSLIL